ncbi:hypothetical protein HK099_001216 [Clydaea vesicula]|uniref:Uncharacterized protein n=1 Tax=Clydaea vesicula TaxID=447962 RepID=A0AAD5U864_9FUNG|nr:hypothetical protein HK099_001216 [Clydaea vesicula]
METVENFLTPELRIKLINYTDATLSSMQQLAKTIISLKKNFHDASEPYPFFIPDYLNFAVLAEKYYHYYTPIIFLYLLLILTILSMIVVSIMYCCCGQEYTRFRRAGYSKFQKIYALLFFVLIFITQLIAVVGGFLGASTFSRGVEFSKSSILTLSKDYQTFKIDNLDSVLHKTANSLKSNLKENINLNKIRSHIDESTEKFFLEVQNAVKNVGEVCTDLKQDLTKFHDDANKVNELTLLVKSRLDEIVKKVFEINDIQSDTNGGKFRLLDEFEIKTGDLFNTIADVDEKILNINKKFLEYISDYNFNDINNIITSDFETLNSYISENMKSVTEEITTLTLAKIDFDHNALVNLTNIFMHSANETKKIFSDNNTFTKFFNYINGVNYVAFSITLAQLIFITIFIARSKIVAVRRCTLLFTFFWLVLSLLLLAYLAIGTTISDGCHFIYENNLNTMGDSYSGLWKGIRSVLDECYYGNDNKSFQNTGFDVKNSVESAIILQDWIDDMPGMTYKFKTMLGDFNSQDLAQNINEVVNTNYWKTLPDEEEVKAINATINSTAFQLQNVGTIYEYFPKLTGADDIRISFVKDVLSNQKAYLNSRLNTVIDEIKQSLIMQKNLNTEFIEITKKFNGLKNLLYKLNEENKVLSDLELIKNSAYAKLLNTLPTLRLDALKNSSISPQQILNKGLTCKVVSEDLFAVQSSVCNVMLNGVDYLWFALMIICFNGLFSIPIYVTASNHLADLKKVKANLVEKPSKKKSKKLSKK